ncbi:hypothetical protein G4B88_027450 [Cannabis sativa]|uniref:Acyl-coenzyme A thioesterase 13 n=1 Tax=Cannabis sativa TaxID=3483 RepID=A0A7J6FTY6_CANSA|nr:hypothetical protein G4B88_027450 [Cannabis sativa]
MSYGQFSQNSQHDHRRRGKLTQPNLSESEGKSKMEKAKQFLQPTQADSDIISRLVIPTHRPGADTSFYEDFALKGIRVDRVEQGLVVCTFKVPPRLADRNGKLATAAIANLVDEVGGAVAHTEGLPMNVSVDMSISFLSSAMVGDELEITSRLLGRKGGYSGTLVLLKNKVSGELIAEGRHSLVSSLFSPECLFALTLSELKLILILCHLLAVSRSYLKLKQGTSYYRCFKLTSGMPWFSAVPWSGMAVMEYLAGLWSDLLVCSGTSITLTRKIMQEITPQYFGVLHGLSNTAGTFFVIVQAVGSGFFVELAGSFQGFLLLTSLLYFPTAIFHNIFSTGERVNFYEPESDSRAAAKKFAGIITLAFLFKQSKASLKATNNGQFRGVSTPSDVSTGSYSRNSSSKYRLSESYGSNGGAASGKIGTPNFTFAEINKATQKFSLANKLGEGGFGAVYKGLLQNGTLIAVKRAKKKTYDRAISAEFSNEILTLSTIEHMNLSKGSSEENFVIFLTIALFLIRANLVQNEGKRGDGLEMAERLDIATDVAHAVTYLHMYTDPPIIHRDIKASNILITEKLRAKVADFGFARRTAEQETDATHISTQVKGTAGYLDPEYLRTYQLTDKSDVYSFGVLLVELMTGRQPIETKKPDSERLTLRWAMQKLKHGEPVLAMDPRLRRNPASNMALERVLKLAQECVAPLRNSRPSMKKCGEVLWEIRKEFREKAFPSHPPPTSHHSSNFPQGDPRFTRHVTFGIEDDSYKFISA